MLKEKHLTLIAIIYVLCLVSLTCDAASHCDVCETYTEPSHWENVEYFIQWGLQTGDWQGMAANITSEFGLHELAAAISNIGGGVQ
mgnify:CR=1 FL=1